MTIRRSPNRGTFQMKDREDYEELFKSYEQRRLDLEETDEWKVDNLEYDLRTHPMIIDKCQDTVYAQHLYAALCNNEFQKNDVFPILSEKKWSCSWRHAGGIIADIRQEGDYIDWYCSGIRGSQDMLDEEFQMLTKDQQEHYLQLKSFVSESVVTDEIREDLFTLGWIVLEEK